MIEKTKVLTDKELIAYLDAVIGTIGQVMGPEKLDCRLGGNCPTVRELIDRARQAAKTNEVCFD
ncbi:MAG: hypothetical protein LLG01_00630 [Planctomycetaceae bacterium]|nr:hypothetical protein [Planctomycetaceae bacterium]